MGVSGQRHAPCFLQLAPLTMHPQVQIIEYKKTDEVKWEVVVTYLRKIFGIY
jgi:hypothetical protein